MKDSAALKKTTEKQKNPKKPVLVNHLVVLLTKLNPEDLWPRISLCEGSLSG